MATVEEDTRAWGALSRVVRDRRKALGWRQGDVAARGGPSEATVRNVESQARSSYSPATLRSLESVLLFEPGLLDKVLDGVVLEGSPELAMMLPPTTDSKRALREARDRLRGYSTPMPEPEDSMADWNRKIAEASNAPVSLLASAVARLSAGERTERQERALWHAMEALSLLREENPPSS